MGDKIDYIHGESMKKRSKIDIIFIIYLLVGSLVLMIQAFPDESFSLALQEILTMQNLTIEQYLLIVLFGIGLFIFFYIISFFLFALKNFFIIAIYIGSKIARKNHEKEKLDINDLKYDNYYRDIIKQYSPASLSYIDDFHLDKKDLVATLMSLELKSKITIDETIKIVNVDEIGLEENEKYVLNSLKNDRLQQFNYLEFEQSVISDCLKYKLLEKKDDIKYKSKIVIVVMSLMFLLSVFFNIILMIFLDGVGIQNILLVLLIFFSFALLAFLSLSFPIIIISYYRKRKILNTLDPFVRTKKGQKINEKLEGLKKFINHFSNLENRNHKELAIWNEYLIYSVLFNKNNDIVEQVINKIR